jgi:hypothetical protein
LTIAQLRVALENVLRAKTISLKPGLTDDEHRLNNEFRELNAHVRGRTGGGQAKGKGKSDKKEKAAGNPKEQVKNEAETKIRTRASKTAAPVPTDPSTKTKSTKTKTNSSVAVASTSSATNRTRVSTADLPEALWYDSDSEASEGMWINRPVDPRRRPAVKEFESDEKRSRWFAKVAATSLMITSDDEVAAKPRNKGKADKKKVKAAEPQEETRPQQMALLPAGRGSGQVPHHQLEQGVMHVGGIWEIKCEECVQLPRRNQFCGTVYWTILYSLENRGNSIECSFKFIIQQSTSDGSFLASFDLGILTGLFRPLAQSHPAIASPSISSKPPIAFSYIRFEWCGRETGGGELQLPNPRRTGWIRFETDKTGPQRWGDKRVAETLKGGIDTGFAGTCKFDGVRMDYKNGHKIGEEWEDYNEDKYEREWVGRWRWGVFFSAPLQSLVRRKAEL